MSNESAASIKAEETIVLRPTVSFSRVNHGKIYETLKEMSPREQGRYIEQMLIRAHLLEDLVRQQLTPQSGVKKATPQQAETRQPWMDIPI